MSHTFKCVLPVIIGLVVYGLQFVVGLPDGVTSNQWLYFSIFLGTIVALVLEPIPAALIGLIGIVVAVLCKVGPKGSGVLDAKVSSAAAIKWGLEGFSNSTIWLIFAAFMIGIGYSKSGLGRRIALVLVSKLGKTSLGLGYAVTIAEGILSPFIPSNSARSGGTIYPIVSSIPPMFNSHPNDPSAKKIGSYLCWVALASTCVTSSMFLTALAPNLLAIEVAAKSGVLIPTWGGWFISAAPAMMLLFLLNPYIAYKLYSPEVKKADDVAKWANNELGKLGGITKKEIAMGLISIGGLVFWIGSKFFGIHSTTTAILMIIAMIFSGILKWDDILSNKPAWSTLVWFSTLVTLAGGLGNVGFLAYLSKTLGVMLSGFSPIVAVLGLVAVFYFIHYFFASGTAHVAALLSVFIAIASGIPGFDASVVTLLMLLSLGIMGIITPYGTGPSPLWFASGYIPSADFWRLGAIFGRSGRAHV